MTAITNLLVDEILPSPFNPRKHFDEGAIAELANSIRQVGLQQPVVVRVVGGEFELVFGHRRLKASKLAGLTQIPAIEREYSDDQVLEIQIVENSQREDVHPLDEADGFKVLRDRNYTVAAIADKIGRTASHVAARLQLTALTKASRKALDDELLTLGAAMVLARVPAKLQDEALDEILPREEWLRGDHGEQRMLPGPAGEKFAREVIVSKFMLKLANAEFDTTDPKLVPKAGACTECPKKSGNQVELFSDVASPDLCTDPICYRAKCGEAFKRLKASKPADVQGFVTGVEAQYVVRGHSSKYSKADDTFYHSKSGKNLKVSTVAKRGEIKSFMAQDPDSGVIVRVYDRTEISNAASKQAADKSKPAKVSAAEQRDKDARKAANRKAKLDAAVVEATMQAAVKAAPFLDDDALVRALVLACAQQIWSDGQRLICLGRGLEVIKTSWGSADYGKTLREHIDGLDGDGLDGMAVELALRTFKSGANMGVRGSVKGDEAELVKALKLDEKAIRKSVVDAMAPKVKPKKKAAAA